ncbi:MYG1 family protein [Patescibacteria group bacterium]|nr:MAG: MYG1 family protein [Patescibacteria group bacterium]
MGRTIVTHSGSFHPDEIFAIATLFLAHPEERFTVIRSRDESDINSSDIAVDVGGVYEPEAMRFDHHQAGGAGIRENGVPYASFGLVWKSFGAEVAGSAAVAGEVERKLAIPIDAVDNGIKLYKTVLQSIEPYTIVDFFSSFEPVLGRTKESAYQTFIELIQVAKSLLMREIDREKESKAQRNKVEEMYQRTGDKRVIILEEYLPWQKVLVFHPEPLYVIYPNFEEGKWRVQAVPVETHSFELRKPFPAAWAGLGSKELSRASGVPDALFCHNNLFIASAESREGAIRLAKKALAE